MNCLLGGTSKEAKRPLASTTALHQIWATSTGMMAALLLAASVCGMAIVSHVSCPTQAKLATQWSRVCRYLRGKGIVWWQRYYDESTDDDECSIHSKLLFDFGKRSVATTGASASTS